MQPERHVSVVAMVSSAQRKPHIEGHEAHAPIMSDDNWCTTFVHHNEPQDEKPLVGWCGDCDRMVSFPHRGMARPIWFMPPTKMETTADGEIGGLRRRYDRVMHGIVHYHLDEPGALVEVPSLASMDDWFTDPDVPKP